MKLRTISLDVVKIEDIVWAYHNITTHKQGAILPAAPIPPGEVGKTFAIIINTANPIAPTIRISTTQMSDMDECGEDAIQAIEKSQRMSDIFEELKKRNPSAIYGYSSELATLWAKDKNKFIQDVKQGIITEEY